MRNEKIIILYEDRDIIVCFKPAKLLTIRTSDKKTYFNNAYHFLKERQLAKKENLFIVHRLDFDTSGLLIFAKNYTVKERLQSIFEQRRVERCYEAVVREDLPLNKKYQVRQYLTQNKSHQVYVTKDKVNGKEAITLLESKNHIKEGSVLDIRILTGRKNQIRLAIRELGLTLIGDERYSRDKADRMYLNAYRLAFPKEAKLKKPEFEIKPLWLKKD